MNELSVQGVVERCLFQSELTGFAIVKIKTTKETVTLVGNLSTLKAGQQLMAKGNWIVHPTFGKQFSVISFHVELPSSPQGLKRYLASGVIKGIGKSYAEKLVNHFGVDVLKIIEHEPDKLRYVEGIGPKRIEEIKNAWKDQKQIASIMVFLQDKGVSSSYALKIFKRYGSESVARLQENPYKLADEIHGIGFKSADSIAQSIGFDKHSDARIQAGILFFIAQQSKQGHLYVASADLIIKAKELLELSEEHDTLVRQALQHLHTCKQITILKKQHEDTCLYFVTLTTLYLTEKSVAQEIKRLCDQTTSHQVDHDAIYQQLRCAQDIDLHEQQQQGIMHCFVHKLSIITGGPGTGKTTLVKKLIDIIEYYNLSYKIAAPTGRAAKRIQEGTHKFALTLHRLLEFDVKTKSFVHNQSNTLKTDFLIIDESSMVDIFLMRSVLQALHSKTHLVLLGDIDQLPSVGAGNVLSDLIHSNKVAYVRLEHIFRQAHNSLIVLNAHRINKGELPLFTAPDTLKDFYFIKQEDPNSIIEHLKKIYTQTLPRYRINPENTVVLTPMNRASAGTFNLNTLLQSYLNADGHPSLVFKDIIFRRGDRVMQLVNNYEKNIFNGDIGTIRSIDQDNKTIHVQFDHLIPYEYQELEELSLAYALSIHKSQGSEYDAVIIPLFMQHFMLLQRNLIYTAITRAKRLCIIIGQYKALAMGIKNKKMSQRVTFLKDMLQDSVECV